MLDQYLKYSAMELAMDDAFIQWSKSPDHPDDEQWKSWLVQNPHMMTTIEEAKHLVRSLHFKEEVVENRVDPLWDRIESTISRETLLKSPPTLKGRQIRWMWMAAASLVLLVAIRFAWPTNETIMTDRGEQLAYTLPDASVVHLNDGSEIQFDKKRFTDERIIQLRGEAFFEVEKGSRFVVQTGKGAVEVLGTSFNVFSHDGYFEVHCKTGRVRVSTEQEDVVLTPGISVIQTEDGALLQDTFEPSKPIGWLQGTFAFENQSLSRVLSELERQFAVSVQFSDEIGALKYSGFFDDRNLEQALYNICWPLQLKSAVDGTHIVIEK